MARNIFIINLNRVWNSINFCSLNFLSALILEKCNEIANLGCATPTSDRLAGTKTNRKPLKIAVRNRKNELRHDSLFLSCEQASDTMKTERTVSSILSSTREPTARRLGCVLSQWIYVSSLRALIKHFAP